MDSHVATNDPNDVKKQILCCLCGVSCLYNPSNMCASCIATQVDITEGVQREYIINWCRDCGRYLQPPKFWAVAELESQELLALCLKKIKGLNNKKDTKLLRANFIWTEPHSRRLKLKVTLQQEIFNGTLIQQSFLVDYIIQTQQCPSCKKTFTDHLWVASVQVRQKVDHKRTFLFLEQLIIKHEAQKLCVGILEHPAGLDFNFNNKSHAQKFIDFICSQAPIRWNQSKQLISQDFSSNTVNYKYTFIADIARVCKEDLVCFPKSMYHALGGAGPFVICYKVNSSLHFVDPNTLKYFSLPASVYWKRQFPSLLNSRHLVEFTILDIEYDRSSANKKFQLAELQLVRSKDLGYTNTYIFVKTHLGKILKAGDLCLGYDLTQMNQNDDLIKEYKNLQVPDAVIIRKASNKNKNNRKWKLAKLTMQHAEDTNSAFYSKKKDEEAFYAQLEADKELRSRINMYRDPQYKAKRAMNADDDEDEQMADVDNEAMLDVTNNNDDYASSDDIQDDELLDISNLRLDDGNLQL